MFLGVGKEEGIDTWVTGPFFNAFRMPVFLVTSLSISDVEEEGELIALVLR